MTISRCGCAETRWRVRLSVGRGPIKAEDGFIPYGCPFILRSSFVSSSSLLA